MGIAPATEQSDEAQDGAQAEGDQPSGRRSRSRNRNRNRDRNQNATPKTTSINTAHNSNTCVRMVQNWRVLISR